MGNKKILDKIKSRAVPILKKHGVLKAGIFGSYATGKTKKNSDVDILVEIKKDISLLDFIGIQLELEKVLNKKVDLVEYQTIKSIIKERILNEEVRII